MIISIGIHTGNEEWWQAEMMETARIDHIMIRTDDWALKKGFLER